MNHSATDMVIKLQCMNSKFIQRARVLVLGTMLAFNASALYATDLFGRATGSIKTLYVSFVEISLPIAALCFVVCCIAAFFQTTPQGTQKWVSYGKKIIIIYALILGISYIFTTVKSTIGDSTGDVFGL